MDWRRISLGLVYIVLVAYIGNTEACNCTQPPPCLSVNGEPIKFPEIENQNSVDHTSDIPCLSISCPMVSLGPLPLDSDFYYHGHPGVCVDTHNTFPTATPVSVGIMRCTAVEIVYDDSTGNKTEGAAVELFTKCPDIVAPICSPMNDTIAQVQLGEDGTTVQFEEPAATDDSNDTVTLQSRTHAPAAFFPVGITEVCYNFSDASLNTVECCFNVTVIEDIVALVCSPINDTIEQVQLGEDGTTVQFEEPAATDSSNDTVTLQSRTHAPGAFFPVGITEVCYNFSDASLNTVECCFNVTVIEVDTMPPYCSSLVENINLLIPTGANGTKVDFTDPKAADNSGNVTLLSRTHASGDFFPLGNTEVCYTFADPSLNTVDCCFPVIVNEMADKTTTTAKPTTRCHPNETNCKEPQTGQRKRCRNCGWIVVLFIPIVIIVILAVRRRRNKKCWIVSHISPGGTVDKDTEASTPLRNGSSTKTTTVASPKSNDTSATTSSVTCITNQSYEEPDDGRSTIKQKTANNKETDQRKVSNGENSKKGSTNDAKKRKSSAAKNDGKTRKQSAAKK